MKRLFYVIWKFIKSSAFFLKSYWKHILAICLCIIILLAIKTGLSVFDSGQQLRLQREADNTASNIVNDVTGLNPIETKGIIVPHTTEEIAKAVKDNDHVSIGGGRYSMGGQTASNRAVQIDMREFNKILNISTTTKEVTVQAGARWRDIQDRIDPYNLSIKIMQTYSNFTVGGSLSVNVHGRYVGLGPVILSVKNIKLVLADGKIVTASPTQNPELFYSAIGGYGGIGVIVEATLFLEDNIRIERSRQKMPISEYKNYFFENVRNSSTTLFHNGDIYPPHFDFVSAVSWNKTEKEVTTDSKLIPPEKDYYLERFAWIVMSEWPFGKWIREHIFEPIIYSSPAVHTRNFEASYDVAELEPRDREKQTFVLQEYFVPVERFDEFYPKMKEVFLKNNVNLLNVSIRHALPDPGSKLAWAKTESFAFVVYYKQGTDDKSKKAVAGWTREMIDKVLEVGGSYYLPYQPHATDEQFHRAYPGAVDYFRLKKKYDPNNKFTNTLWDKYYSIEKQESFEKIKEAKKNLNLKDDYYRRPDNMYLSVPEWYIVYSGVEYARALKNNLPSKFDYRQAIKDYWSQHSKVKELASGSENQQSDYLLVLKVIGVSFTFENSFKWAYENTIGLLTEKLAGNQRVEEDEFYADMNATYAEFLYDYPWYNFPYKEYYDKLKSLPDLKEKYTMGEKIRKFERSIFFRFEIIAKRVYSSLIKKATESKFGAQDDVVYAIVKEGKSARVVEAPHYQPFTKELLKTMEEARKSTRDFEVLEISGNTKITLTYIDEVGAESVPNATELMRDSEVFFEDQKEIIKDRVTMEVETKNIFKVFNYLKDKGINIDHFYDY